MCKACLPKGGNGGPNAELISFVQRCVSTYTCSGLQVQTSLNRWDVLYCSTHKGGKNPKQNQSTNGAEAHATIQIIALPDTIYHMYANTYQYMSICKQIRKWMNTNEYSQITQYSL